MEKRWGLNIDVEGFSALYEYSEDGKTKAIFALRDLMQAIISIGRLTYPGDPTNNESDRIFAHQFGDGFILVSNFEEIDATRCVSIGIALMRHMTMKGHATKVAISTGGMSDIKGCYPKVVCDADGDTISLGAGLMTTIPVMGTALTKAHKLGTRVSGNVLVVDITQFGTYPEDVLLKVNNNIAFIDWKSDKFELPRTISEKAGLEYGDTKLLYSKYQEYISSKPTPPDSWIEASEIS
jgi:hypothetical protein